MNPARSRQSDDDENGIDESGRAAIKWMVAMTSGGLSERQRRDFEVWYGASPANAEAWGRMAGNLQPFGIVARSGLPRGTVARMGAPPRRDRRNVVAGLTALAAGGAVALERFVPLEDLLTDRFTRTAAHARFRLGQDAEVVMAPRSALNLGAAAETRALSFLRGKILLDIQPRDARPFVVEAGPFRIEALAGAFVIERAAGAFRFASLRGDGTLWGEDHRRFSVASGERITVAEGEVRRSAVDADAASSWTSGFAVLREETVAAIVDEIRPYFAGIIRLHPDAASRRATGVFNLFEPVASLGNLARAVNLTLTRTAGFWIALEPRRA
ncbi:Fe2+-dicitrate sensor membrane component-like protein [Methylobacterium sp. 4-46]|uniref:FecR family protein n=2 Tax=unclassified Methylobacterium TaxID=2615210 RepID=UPI000152E7DE|nr:MULTISPECIES: DUF4880 domain-containing protein [Methylobacterium]ACA15804.1 Fe2+-dicitrate sensor membrane component-like protein [Methylobacterium sp. 4-46]WFT81533.1 DUF4880 domain-containing protein [Methylobacterium nodulans]